VIWLFCSLYWQIYLRPVSSPARSPRIVLSCAFAKPDFAEPHMKFVHQREHLNEDDIVVIECSQRCNIRLMNDANFRSFKNGGRHTYHGGHFDKFPAKITVPSTGFWNITIDTVTTRPISVTRKPSLTHKIKIIRRSSSQLR
jgi:hypothetical protein